MFGSPRDLGRVSRMLLSGGELDGVRVISRESVALILSSARHSASISRLPTECMGMSAFGLGLGWCSHESGNAALKGVDDCEAPDWYGWAGSFGSRYAFITSARSTAANADASVETGATAEGAGDGRLGIYCVMSANILQVLGRGGERVTGRHHAVMHNLTVLMRGIWPAVPPAVATGECDAADSLAKLELPQHRATGGRGQ